MNEIKIPSRFDSVLYAFPKRISTVLEKLPEAVKGSVYEIRVRNGRPLCLTGDRVFYVTDTSEVDTRVCDNCILPTSSELNEIIMRITGRSVYARERELAEGYLSMRMGNRAGVCGRFAAGNLVSVSSVNIRIAREIIGCADALIPYCGGGLLIAGPPGSGKTTLLRDIVRSLSYSGKKISVVDTRGEICGRVDESFALDTGPNTDVISGMCKERGVEMALRTMFPEYIAFDEVGNGKELDLIRESFFSGVRILTTAHAESKSDLLSRRVTQSLINAGIKSIALISGKPGSPIKMLGAEEVLSLA